jgi:hypothetical protein
MGEAGAISNPTEFFLNPVWIFKKLNAPKKNLP